MLLLTPADFNTLLNFSDFRSSELTLSVDDAVVPSRDLVSRFESNTDVILDRVDVRLVAAKVRGVRAYLIELEKGYPFHEALIRITLRISAEQGFSYVPILFSGRNSHITIPEQLPNNLSAYGVAYQGNWEAGPPQQLVRLGPGKRVELRGDVLGAVFMPKPYLHAAVMGRMGQLEGGGQRSEAANALFIDALLSCWPCSAMGRLSTYIHMRSGASDVIGFGVEAYLGGTALSGRLSEIYEEAVLAPGVTESKAPNSAVIRSPVADALALRGQVVYRKGEWSKAAGWAVFVAPEDPFVEVRSNGIVRWMRLGHGLVESIERLSDGRNLALGPRTAMELHGHLIEDRNVLYGGLGLGVIQRQLALDSTSITCEINPGVISAFKYVCPDAVHQMQIVNQDIYKYVRTLADGVRFSMAFLDFYDAEMRILRHDDLAAVLRVAKVLVINKHISGPDDLANMLERLRDIGLPVETHVAEGKQLVVKISAKP